MSKIYLASPYSHPSHLKRIDRWKDVCKLYSKLIEVGHAVYCPIAFHHPLAVALGLPTDAGYWKKQNKAFLEWAEILMVYKLVGWEESDGIQWEIGIGSKLSKEIVFEDPI